VPVDIAPRVLTTAIDLDDTTASLELAFDVADYFGVAPDDARTKAASTAKVVSSWRREAARVGAGKDEVERMASAFEHEDLKQALAA